MAKVDSPAYTSPDPTIEGTYERTKRVRTATLGERLREARKGWRAVFVTSPELKGDDVVAVRDGRPLTRTEFFAVGADQKRLTHPLHRTKLEEAQGILTSIFSTLRTPEQYDLFQRRVMVDEALEAHARNAEFETNAARAREAAELHEALKADPETPKDLLTRAKLARHEANVALKAGPQFENREPGETAEAMQAEAERLDALMTPEVQSAYDRHLQAVHAFRDELIARNIIAPNAREFYFPHYILDAMKETQGANLPRGRGLAKTRAGSTRQRVGGREWSRDYLAAMGKYLTETSEMLARHDMLDEIAMRYHVTSNPMDHVLRKPAGGGKSPMELYKESGIIPPGYVNYTLTTGLTSRRMTSPGERYFGELIDNVLPEVAKKFGVSAYELRAAMDPRFARMRESRAGAARINDEVPMHGLDVVIPKELADELTVLGAIERKVGILQKAEKGMGLFKSTVLQVTPVQYNKDNFVGDFQRALAQFGPVEMFNGRRWREAFEEVKAAYLKRRFSGDWQDASKYGLMSSGYVATEAHHWAEMPAFERLFPEGHDFRTAIPRATKGLLRALGRFSHAREDMTRLYVYKMNKERVSAGKDVLTGTLDRTALRGLVEGEEPARVFAAIARKSLIDYGDFTPSEELLSNTMIPFYRWAKGNLSFWLKDLPVTTAKALQHTATGRANSSDVAVLSGVATITALALTARAWNSQFGDYEEKMPEGTQTMTHVIIPSGDTDANGNMIPLLNAEGRPYVLHVKDAMDDALDFINAGDIIPDAKAVLDGAIDPKEFVSRRIENSKFRGVPFVKGPIDYLGRAMGPVLTVPTAVMGVKTFPSVTEARPVPEEQRHELMAGALGVRGVPFVGSVIEALSPNSVVTPNTSIFDSPAGRTADVPGQLGLRTPQLLRRPRIENDLIIEIRRTQGELNALKGDIKRVSGGLSLPQLTDPQQRARAARLERILQTKADKLRRLAERYHAIQRTQTMEQTQ